MEEADIIICLKKRNKYQTNYREAKNMFHGSKKPINSASINFV